MNSPRKILLIDKASDRKERIGLLKANGYAVFPALRLEEARSRCMRGGYDLIVVNAEGQPQEAVQFCDTMRTACPSQPLLMCIPAEGEVAGRDYVVSAAPDALLQRVNALLPQSGSPGGYANAA
jgi:DNA-binding response OmpR family regulator